MNVARGNLGLSAGGLFTLLIVTHVSIRTCDTSSRPLDPPSSAYTTLLYHQRTEDRKVVSEQKSATSISGASRSTSLRCRGTRSATRCPTWLPHSPDRCSTVSTRESHRPHPSPWRRIA